MEDVALDVPIMNKIAYNANNLAHLFFSIAEFNSFQDIIEVEFVSQYPMNFFQ